jgi:hypothetical protein
MPVVLHGDAAFSGQGIVPEVMEVDPGPKFQLYMCMYIYVYMYIYTLLLLLPLLTSP